MKIPALFPKILSLLVFIQGLTVLASPDSCFERARYTALTEQESMSLCSGSAGEFAILCFNQTANTDLSKAQRVQLCAQAHDHQAANCYQRMSFSSLSKGEKVSLCASANFQ